MELQATKSEVKELRSEADMFDQIRAQFEVREAELEEVLKKSTANIDELKASLSLIDKKSELQCISEENDNMNTELNELCNRVQELGVELMKLREYAADMKTSLMDKEKKLQKTLEENEVLKLVIRKQETDKVAEANKTAAELNASRATEQEALMKLGYMTLEVDKSNRKAGHLEFLKCAALQASD